MNIQYLKKLQQNPNGYHGFSNEPLTLTEITTLETKYNSGNPFPLVLKEFLYLAGGDCIYTDMGVAESQEELQDDSREELTIDSLSIARPFFVLTTYSGWFQMIYLDEGDNPSLYHLDLEPVSPGSSTPKIEKVCDTLSGYIDGEIHAYQTYYGPE